MHEHTNKKHMLLMVLACSVPLLLVILLPLFGIKFNVLWIGIGLMLIIHIWMMKGHTKHH